MNSVIKLQSNDIDGIPFQDASLDIWDKKIPPRFKAR